MPDEKLSYKQIVHKIIYDSGYANEIADLIVRARRDPPDQGQYRELESRFDPRDDELGEIRLSKEALGCRADSPNKGLFATTPTTFMFARFFRGYCTDSKVIPVEGHYAKSGATGCIAGGSLARRHQWPPHSPWAVEIFAPTNTDDPVRGWKIHVSASRPISPRYFCPGPADLGEIRRRFQYTGGPSDF